MLTNIHVWVGLATCALVATPWQRAAGEQRRDVPVRDVAAIVRVVLESRLPKPADDGRRAPFTYFVEIEGWNAAEVLRELRQRHPSWLSTQQKLGTTLKPHSEMVTNATGCASIALSINREWGSGLASSKSSAAEGLEWTWGTSCARTCRERTPTSSSRTAPSGGSPRPAPSGGPGRPW